MICYLFPSSAVLCVVLVYVDPKCPNPLPTTCLMVEGVSELLSEMFSSDFGTSKEISVRFNFYLLQLGLVFLDILCGIAICWPKTARDVPGVCFR